MAKRWRAEEAAAWAAKRPWPVGCNYLPAYAANQIEFWSAELFDAAAIARELGHAADLGFNSLRVYLHDVAWDADPSGFLARLDRFLDLATGQGLATLFVIFDSVWHPYPQPGPQRPPEPGVHNSGWVQSPGALILRDPVRFGSLERYVRDVVGTFRHDSRILGWDIWNEPDNQNFASYYSRDLMDEKAGIVLPLVEQAFGWARAEQPSQPLTAGVWTDSFAEADMPELARRQCALSDIISFHWYGPLPEVAERVAQLRRFNRPIWCTEYLARSMGSRFETHLPWFRRERIGAFSWGLVKGRTLTHLPWSTWRNPATADPDPWFHDIVNPDGTPWNAEEARFLREFLKPALS
jgi:hypothetical protein